METLKRLPFKARKAVFEKLEEIADVASMSPKEQRTGKISLQSAKPQPERKPSLRPARPAPVLRRKRPV